MSFFFFPLIEIARILGLISAITWPAGLLGLASVIDNPWGVCLRRSSQVGKQLAEVLLARDHGHRPVTLVGYSLGARVIFYCLRVNLTLLISIRRSSEHFKFSFLSGNVRTQKLRRYYSRRYTDRSSVYSSVLRME